MTRYRIEDFAFKMSDGDVTAQCVHCMAHAYMQFRLAPRAVVPHKRKKYARTRARKEARESIQHEHDCALIRAAERSVRK